jgi:hypothetical protein
MAVKSIEAEQREAIDRPSPTRPFTHVFENGRSKWSRSAEFVYNHILTPGMLIYIAEAVDIDRELLNTAANAAQASRSIGSMSRAIRRIVPWRMVRAALLAVV